MNREGQSTQSRMKILLTLILLFAPQFSFAQYSIDWYRIAGGGNTSRGGTYSVTGTIGQSEAGSGVGGGSAHFVGGFWAI